MSFHPFAGAANMTRRDYVLLHAVFKTELSNHLH
ncbi:hypothetical protein J2X06_001685 [Lysobacter niastensis]|uniref:Uncharacterized protein n=1 Tax=Lysobacter niastensis TaxID=380629 RepID=A0ABU1WA50_9GAMM|nr:hypothetical protein [Lysobacter niastensis]